MCCIMLFYMGTICTSNILVCRKVSLQNKLCDTVSNCQTLLTPPRVGDTFKDTWAVEVPRFPATVMSRGKSPGRIWKSGAIIQARMPYHRRQRWRLILLKSGQAGQCRYDPSFSSVISEPTIVRRETIEWRTGMRSILWEDFVLSRLVPSGCHRSGFMG